MQVSELRDALSVFNPSVPVEAAVPQMGQAHVVKDLRVVCHLSHPGVAHTDHTTHALDILCDHWTDSPSPGDKLQTVGDLLSQLQPFPDPMHVRIALPISHADHSHRLLDIVMVGRMAGSQGGARVQLVTENIEYTGQVVREHPHAIARRQAEQEALSQMLSASEAGVPVSAGP